jgi:hypothetical protein
MGMILTISLIAVGNSAGQPFEKPSIMHRTRSELELGVTRSKMFCDGGRLQ